MFSHRCGLFLSRVLMLFLGNILSAILRRSLISLSCHAALSSAVPSSIQLMAICIMMGLNDHWVKLVAWVRAAKCSVLAWMKPTLKPKDTVLDRLVR